MAQLSVLFSWAAIIFVLLMTTAQAATCTSSEGEGPEMVLIPGGEFLMGSPKVEVGRAVDEGPDHRVNIGKFMLSVCEVTVGEFTRFVEDTGYTTDAEKGRGCFGYNAASNKLERSASVNWRSAFEQSQHNDEPVTCVSWNDAKAYSRWLSIKANASYRLPTEAEWEYAARAGTTSPFYTGECISTEQANYSGTMDYNDCGAKTGEYRERTVAVDDLDASNLWGLRHMLGNVHEWTEDCYHDTYNDAPIDGRAWLGGDAGDCERRVLRGGGWSNYPRFLRSAYRISYNSDETDDIIGFRVARTP